MNQNNNIRRIEYRDEIGDFVCGYFHELLQCGKNVIIESITGYILKLPYQNIRFLSNPNPVNTLIEVIMPTYKALFYINEINSIILTEGLITINTFSGFNPQIVFELKEILGHFPEDDETLIKIITEIFIRDAAKLEETFSLSPYDRPEKLILFKLEE